MVKKESAVKQTTVFYTPTILVPTDSEVGIYFSENNLVDTIKGEDRTYLKGNDMFALLNMAVEIINRAGMNRDLDFVKSNIREMISEINQTIANNNSTLRKQIDEIVKYNFDENVSGSYLQVVKDRLKSSLKDSNDTLKATVELLLKNAEKLSTDKMTDVESKLTELKDKLNPNLETSYLGILKKTVTSVQDNIDAQFDDTNTNSFVNKLQEELEKIGAEDSPLVEEMQNIMERQQKSISDKLQEIRDLISKEQGKEELIEKTAQLKGQNFEDELFDTLQLIAKPFGDEVEMTGTKAEVGGSKKGDFIYKFAEGTRIVIEAKDTKLTLPPMIKYLNDAMQTRDCNFSILIAKNEDCLPKQIGNFNFYDDNKLFVTADFLEHAIRWTRLFFGKIRTEKIEGIDKTAIERSLNTIQTTLKTFTTIKSKLTKLDKAVNSSVVDINNLLESVQSDLETELQLIAEELQEND